MVGRAMESAAIAAVWITGGALVDRIHQRCNPSDVALICERQQVIHQIEMFFERLGSANWRTRHVLLAVRQGCRGLDAPFNFPYVIEITVEANTIGRRKALLE